MRFLKALKLVSKFSLRRRLFQVLFNVVTPVNKNAVKKRSGVFFNNFVYIFFNGYHYQNDPDKSSLPDALLCLFVRTLLISV